MKKHLMGKVLFVLIFLSFLQACSSTPSPSPAPTNTTEPTSTSPPTETPQPTNTPTLTPAPTNTIEPTKTPQPTNTPILKGTVRVTIVDLEGNLVVGGSTWIAFLRRGSGEGVDFATGTGELTKSFRTGHYTVHHSGTWGICSERLKAAPARRGEVEIDVAPGDVIEVEFVVACTGEN